MAAVKYRERRENSKKKKNKKKKPGALPRRAPRGPTRRYRVTDLCARAGEPLHPKNRAAAAEIYTVRVQVTGIFLTIIK